MELRYGVMVALQILVLPVQVRVLILNKGPVTEFVEVAGFFWHMHELKELTDN